MTNVGISGNNPFHVLTRHALTHPTYTTLTSLLAILLLQSVILWPSLDNACDMTESMFSLRTLQSASQIIAGGIITGNNEN